MRFVKERSESQPHKYGAESHKRRWEWHGWSGDVYVRTRKCLPRGKSSSKIQVPMANNSFLKLALDSVGPFAFTSDPSLETNYHALNPKDDQEILRFRLSSSPTEKGPANKEKKN